MPAKLLVTYKIVIYIPDDTKSFFEIKGVDVWPAMGVLPSFDLLTKVSYPVRLLFFYLHI